MQAAYYVTQKLWYNHETDGPVECEILRVSETYLKDLSLYRIRILESKEIIIFVTEAQLYESKDEIDFAMCLKGV